MKKLASVSDPLWYKDAIIYELHVRAFADSNNDGIGDFQGLISKLDYLQDLGVTCLWLLPFFPSPLRDDGYDIANYVDVNPAYGTLDDFKQFLDVAHARHMQVMIELVINHTSDQHPWFQAARSAPEGSPARDVYVWSSTDKLYKDARIIFTDTEKSNWTWDDTAKAFYWHRFFSHQPDLNFDNPRVIQEVISAMRFWLDMGVDALRMDAIPYLVERDETNCENLPETHVVIKKIRAAIDAEYANRLVLAEANQWPADVRPYFGDGDECHMAFHFPLMPRIYMALRQEDRLPITDIMSQTPTIPDSCQWGLFLRNHDELTLEMVTADERDYMYLAYSADPRMRINVGIRRRLAPLVDNNRRRIELLNSLLLSFPGTPILYYGDEIGMGDNIYLGDRNGVRTPMQWNSDRNAGFSKCDPARLYFPVVMDPIYGYQTVNVEMQLSDQSSLLHWNRNMIALRKLFQVFGRGDLQFLHPENRKILAYLRSFTREDGTREVVLCVANLSRFAQPVHLDLTQFSGMVPVEMLGYVSFPPITANPYPLTLAPYSFLWFELQPAVANSFVGPENEPYQEQEVGPVIEAVMQRDWDSLAHGEGLGFLLRNLQPWLLRQRWFAAKSRVLQSLELRDYAVMPVSSSAILFLISTYKDGESETYQIPLAIVSGAQQAEILDKAHQSIVATVSTPEGAFAVCDATLLETFRDGLLAAIHGEASMSVIDDDDKHDDGADSQRIIGHAASDFKTSELNENPVSRVVSSEQSNTSIIFDQRLILKLFRRLQPGENPDIEIGRFLTESTDFSRIPAFLGDLTLKDASDRPTSVAMLQQLIPNEGDGWSWTMEELARFYESVSSCPAPKDPSRLAGFTDDGAIPSELEEKAWFYLEAAGVLGRRTAELHQALASGTEEAFRPEPLTRAAVETDADRIHEQATDTLNSLRLALPELKDETADQGALLLSRRLELLERIDAIKAHDVSGKKIRIHGDYHLGQVLREKSDFFLLDFEGEPARTLAERRQKHCPLKDVAGMLRSFSYAAWAAFEQYIQRHPDRSSALTPWVTLWQQSASTSFLRGYRRAFAPGSDLLPDRSDCDLLLSAYLLEKALYELRYELNNRPAWVRVPLAGLLTLTKVNDIASS